VYPTTAFFVEQREWTVSKKPQKQDTCFILKEGSKYGNLRKRPKGKTGNRGNNHNGSFTGKQSIRVKTARTKTNGGC